MNIICRFLLVSLSICCIVSCKTPANTNVSHPEPLPDYVIANEVLVQLNQDNAETLVNSFESYGLNIKKMVSKRMHLFLMEYDAEKIDPRKMLELIKQTEGVTSAEFNKKIGQRED